MSILALRMSQTLQAGSIRPDPVNLIIAVPLTGESDPVAAGRPIGEYIVFRSGFQLPAFATCKVQNV